MLRTIAIFLVTVHLTNIIGSYGIIANMESMHQDKISDELDADEFAGSNAITLRIPFSLPYSTFGDSYERATGKIQYDGQTYFMVKQKFHRDTLFIVCAKDLKSQEIRDAYKNLAASMTDTPGQNSSSKTVNSYSNDFETCRLLEINFTDFEVGSLQLPDYKFSAVVGSISTPHQPPTA